MLIAIRRIDYIVMNGILPRRSCLGGDGHDAEQRSGKQKRDCNISITDCNKVTTF